MSIRTIHRTEFDRLVPRNPTLENEMGEEVEWFSNRSGNLLGTIAKDERAEGWNYAILKRGKNGDSYVRLMMNSVSSLIAARVELLFSMAKMDKSPLGEWWHSLRKLFATR
jgi:hypothetical protein